jgi:hypothetical protein
MQPTSADLASAADTVAQAKQCSACKREKELSLFCLSRRGKLGRHSQCRECQNKRTRARRGLDPEAPYQPITSSRKRVFDTAASTPLGHWLAASITGDVGGGWGSKARKALTVAWLKKWQVETHCSLTGVAFRVGGKNDSGYPSFDSPSLDRIDSAKGYTPANTRVVCLWANRAKSTMSDVEFRLLCQLVSSKAAH